MSRSTPATPPAASPATGLLAAGRALCRDHPIAATLFATTVLSAIFLLFPEIDLAVSGWFHVAGAGFPAESSQVLRDLRALGMFTTRAIIGVFIAVLVLKLAAPHHRTLIPARALLFLASTQALGPGLLVNGLLKEFWGRARPRQTDLFGGDLAFSPPWAIVDQCQSNCSFVSGESASSFWLLAFAFVVPSGWRRPVALAALVWAAVMSLNRVAFGGHYLSDALLAWCLVLLVLLVMRQLVLLRPAPGFDAALEAGLTRVGLALRRPFTPRA